MFAITFAAVMLVAGQLYIENNSERVTAAPSARSASVPWDPRTYFNERPADVNRRALRVPAF
jgi:hypothetical protein